MTKLEKWALLMFIIGIVYLPIGKNEIDFIIYGLMSVISSMIFVNTGNNK